MPGDGEPRSEFAVVLGEKALLHEANALTLTLTPPESYGTNRPAVNFTWCKNRRVIERNLSQ